MPSLRELQTRFAAAVLAPAGTVPEFGIAAPARLGAAERIGIYRNAVFTNYRNALAASYPVVRRLVGTPFFHTAVDAFVHAHPSVSGDLNVYGGAFGDFLAGYPYAADVPYLPDVARLEWAVDEAQRAADAVTEPERVLAALAAMAPERLPALRLRLEPSCRLVASEFPVLHIWQVNQRDREDGETDPAARGDDHVTAGEGDDHVSLDEGADALLVRRGASGVVIARVAAGEHAFLAALAEEAPLGAALDAAQRADAQFDLGAALRGNIAAGVIADVD